MLTKQQKEIVDIKINNKNLTLIDNELILLFRYLLQSQFRSQKIIEKT